MHLLVLTAVKPMQFCLAFFVVLALNAHFAEAQCTMADLVKLNAKDVDGIPEACFFCAYPLRDQAPSVVIAKCTKPPSPPGTPGTPDFEIVQFANMHTAMSNRPKIRPKIVGGTKSTCWNLAKRRHSECAFHNLR